MKPDCRLPPANCPPHFPNTQPPLLKLHTLNPYVYLVCIRAQFPSSVIGEIKMEMKGAFFSE